MCSLNSLLRVVATCFVGLWSFGFWGVGFWGVQPAVANAGLFKDAEAVEFDSVLYTYPPSRFKIERAKKNGTPLVAKTEPSVALTGFLAKPEGQGPYPAIVLLHTCVGLTEHEESWSNKLVDWGYVVLSVDSFTPRGVKSVCEGDSGGPGLWARALDAVGAKRHLQSLPFVDPSRIGALGLSHGAMVVLEIIKQSSADKLSLNPFQAAVALYPLCGEPEPINTPTLVLVGSKDQWTPAEHCQLLFDGLAPPHELRLKIFPDAHHLFDHPGIDQQQLGYVLRSDSAAARQATRLIRKIFEQRL